MSGDEADSLLRNSRPSPASRRSVQPGSRSFEERKPRPTPTYDYNYPYYDEPPEDEPLNCRNAWGLWCGLILLVFIISVLTWAYFEDLREAQELEDAKKRGVDLYTEL
eukprot:TRINITY_DN2011_c4_g1_i1.p1 TRINITY_DN2011_c4_g1~~TRINITY_DN2011_c4_g1_i1.p1  ORF type:complete len:108 (+),score=17.96 TRINITY_DN2011_c4_g1_i1:83-406(+)